MLSPRRPTLPSLGVSLGHTLRPEGTGEDRVAEGFHASGWTFGCGE